MFNIIFSFLKLSDTSVILSVNDFFVEILLFSILIIKVVRER